MSDESPIGTRRLNFVWNPHKRMTETWVEMCDFKQRWVMVGEPMLTNETRMNDKAIRGTWSIFERETN